MGYGLKPAEPKTTMVVSIPKKSIEQVKRDLRLLITGQTDWVMDKATDDFLTEVFIKLKEES